MFVPKGAFALGADILTMPHHHEVLVSLFLLVASTGIWIQLASLFNELFSVCSPSLEERHTILIIMDSVLCLTFSIHDLEREPVYPYT